MVKSPFANLIAANTMPKSVFFFFFAAFIPLNYGRTCCDVFIAYKGNSVLRLYFIVFTQSFNMRESLHFYFSFTFLYVGFDDCSVPLFRGGYAAWSRHSHRQLTRSRDVPRNSQPVTSYNNRMRINNNNIRAWGRGSRLEEGAKRKRRPHRDYATEMCFVRY